MNVIQTIAARRQKLLDGLVANEGDINLKIFEDFYPDEAHFIYELLQNAEDAGATHAFFELFPDHCAFEHNGSRHFNESDIRAITGIFNSSKKDSADKIGKFGVGFKSVFVYTDTPAVFSRDFSFRILNLVLPQEIPPKAGDSASTRFEFPFNNPKKPPTLAYQEIESGLEKLSETALLYLANLSSIGWRAGTKQGAVLREEHSQSHIEVVKEAHGQEVVSSHWLRFTEPALQLERQNVAIAFELALTAKAFDAAQPLNAQFKISPAARGTVSVFFPAEKESSGLRFHLHGPFVPELSRASIKNSPENAPLFAQIADLAAKSLHTIRDLGLLTGEFLSVLPNDDDPLPERYQCIRKAILKEMSEQPLVPAYGGGFAPAAALLQGRAALKGFLTADDLSFVTARSDQPAWAIGATQRNSNQDRFLASLGMQTWDAEDMKSFLESRAREDNAYWGDCELDEDVLHWLQTKSLEWLQALYSVLYRHCEETRDYGHLSEVEFVRLTTGELTTAQAAYFQSTPGNLTDLLPYVDEGILTAGSRKAQQEDARKFLEKLGVRAPNELDELHLLLSSRYSEEGEEPEEKDYIRDLRRMMTFLEKNPTQKGLFAKAYLFKVDGADFTWATSEHVYLDTPFTTSGLRALHQLAPESERRWPLSEWYSTCGIAVERIAKFAKEIGCQTEFDCWYDSANCIHNPNWNYLATAPGGRYGNGFNKDYALSDTARALIRSRKADAILLLWKALCRSESTPPSVLKAAYQVTEKGGPRYADSQLVCTLRELPWVPQTDGNVVKPSAAVPEKLPKGFVIDAGYRWLEAVGFARDEKARAAESSVRATRRKEFGFSTEEELERARAFIRLPEEEQRRILDDAERRHEEVELPERPLRNAALRQQRVAEQASKTPAKETVTRERSVQLGAAEAKVAAKIYLADQYTNSRGQMICQVCKHELPFKLANGSYYFEAVEMLVDSEKRFREGYLALCPNHAAAFVYANPSRPNMQDLLATAAGCEVEVNIGAVDTTIYFTETHLADARACLLPLRD